MRVIIVFAWLVAAIALQSVLQSAPAAAHTGFDTSDPADGDQLSEPVDEVVITFTGEAEPTGEGFVALDPVRGVRTPDEVVTRSGSEWLLRFDPPLSGGEVVVRWIVKAPDAHAISGGFSFTVTAEPESRADQPGPAADTAPDATDGAGSQPRTGAVSDSATVAADESTDAEEAPLGQAQDLALAAGSEPADSEAGVTVGDDDAVVGENILVSEAVEPDTTAADFATAGVERLADAEFLADIGRGLAYAGAVLAIGALVFAMFVLDRPNDIIAVAKWAGTCGLVVVLGAGLQTMAHIYIEYGRWSISNLLDMANTELGYSTGLRAMGGALLWALPMPRFTWRRNAIRTPSVRAGSEPAVQSVSVPLQGGQSGSPSAVATKLAVPDAADAGPDAAVERSVAWRSGSAAAVAIIASVMLVTSHIFDGHTLSKGNRIVMSLATIAHVAAAGAWAGGVVALALTILRRRRRRPVDGAELGARFSVVAAAGLVVVGVVGVALTAMIVDSPSQLWTTDWGRLLLVKVALVLAGALLGGYNHFVLLPRMGARDTVTSPGLSRFSVVLTIEAVLLVSVAVLTGVLAGAAL